MYSNENYSLSQGSAMVIAATLRDEFGKPVVTYDGTESLSTTVWPGGMREVSFTPVTTWSAPNMGSVTIAITTVETAGLAPGRYQVLTRVTPIGGDPVDAYGCTLDVLAFAGSTATPSTYCDYSELLRYGRSWLRQLQTDDDEAGFAEQLGRARTWIDDLCHAHYRVAPIIMVVGCGSFGPRDSGARSPWLQYQLDMNALMVTDQIREAAAKKALAYICEGQVGVSETSVAYSKLARMYHSQADYLGCSMMLSLDTNGDGFPEINIDPSCTNPRYG
jgi:hypothetical protein